MASFLIAAVLAVLVFLCLSDAIIAFSSVHSKRASQPASGDKTGRVPAQRREMLLSLGPRPETKPQREQADAAPRSGGTSAQSSRRSLDLEEHFCDFSTGGRFGPCR